MPGLVHPLQGVKRGELDDPTSRRILDRDFIVSENHFRGCYAELRCHVLDGLSFEDRELLSCDTEAMLSD